jgi:hypothetical protein
MTLDLPTTLAILAVIGAVFVYANWRARQPPQPLKVRMLNYNVVQILTIVVALVFLAHLVTLLGGQTRGAQLP